jgi:hypothetical protein
MPEQVSYWTRARELADSELKDLIEKQIISTGYWALGDFHNKILLSLPPKNTARGTFHLGTVLYKDEKWPVGLSKSELLQNTSIFGRSGAGKTNVAFHLIEQLEEQKIPFLFLDWKRTVRHLLPRLKRKVNIYTPGRKLAPFRFNPFICPPGLEYNVYINQVVDVLADAYTLGDGSRSILQKAISLCYEQNNLSPAVKDIIQHIEKMPDKGRVSNWKISALRAMESLDFAEITSIDQMTQQDMASSLLQENTVIELDSLNQNSKKFIIPLLCLWLYYVKLASPVREELNFVIFLEEAHHVLYKQEKRSHEMLLEMLLRQCREIGIGMVVIDQHPHLISSAVLGNSYTSICLNQKDPSDMSKAAALSLVDAEEKQYFSMLPVGQGIVKLQDRWRKPFLVQFPLVRFQKGAVTDQDISRYFRAKQTGSGRKTSEVLKFEQVPQVHLDDMPLNDMELSFIEDIIAHKESGVKERYKRLGISIGTGNRLKEQLTHSGWLESEVLKMGKIRKLILRVTQQARKALGAENITPEYGSLVHEYWKRFYARRFQEQGYKVQLEVPRKSSGRADVVAIKEDEKIAIEIETGKSDFVQNVKQDLLSGFDKVIVVATDKSALEKLEKELAKTGLIIAGRVEILAGDGRN